MAPSDLPVAENLFKNGHYDWCLFVGHLVLEKILKAHYVRDNKSEPARIHDLVRLAEAKKLDLSVETKEFLFAANAFNMDRKKLAKVTLNVDSVSHRVLTRPKTSPKTTRS